LPRVTNFDLSYQEIINMWPWHIFWYLSRNLSFNLLSQHHSTLSTDFFIHLLFIFLKVFFQNFFFQEKFFDKKLVIFIFSFSSPFAKKNSTRTNRLNSFCVSLLPFPKEQRTNHLNSFVSSFSLIKEFKRTQSENSFDSSLSLKQKISKD